MSNGEVEGGGEGEGEGEGAECVNDEVCIKRMYDTNIYLFLFYSKCKYEHGGRSIVTFKLLVRLAGGPYLT